MRSASHMREKWADGEYFFGGKNPAFFGRLKWVLSVFPLWERVEKSFALRQRQKGEEEEEEWF